MPQDEGHKLQVRRAVIAGQRAPRPPIRAQGLDDASDALQIGRFGKQHKIAADIRVGVNGATTACASFVPPSRTLLDWSLVSPTAQSAHARPTGVG